ncbi:3-ketoacyl-ACP reductase [Fictibacillus phosphorivorans]|uniref:3-ketoacyl-ACP reductase n=1 Tax=Fictibacillus phosphorivorans TaxID=1221500 RepID=A0A163QYI1_9BACL|nr:SDR family oxidoreductase [Fictibacillus phosphorivorans]KZE65936.1 3-ketoacyl-ACP reductase [Fictibacillus phosphorivorans]
MKKVLVTGATGAIGIKISHMLASQGFQLFLHYHSNEAAAIKLQNELIKKYNSSVSILSADLSQSEGPQHLLSNIQEPIDIFVYNCGASHYGLLTDFTEQSIRETVQLHLLSAISLSKSLIPSMIQKKSGKIIMISSVWGEVGAACETVYSAAKGGLNAFVKALSKELAPSQIQVNGISPGVISTPMLNQFSEEEKRELAEDIPAGRFGEPDEVAHAVEFLISAKSDYISGHILSINGSWYT